MRKRTIQIPESALVEILLSYRKDAIKVLLLSDCAIEQVQTFPSEWDLASYLSRRNLSNTIRFMTIAADHPVSVGTPAAFLDEQLLDGLLIIRQDTEGIPGQSDLTVRHGRSFTSRSCPFFIMKKTIPISVKATSNAALLVVDRSSGKLSLREDIRLLRNAGFSLYDSVVTRAPLSSRRQVGNFVRAHKTDLSAVSTIVFSAPEKRSMLTCLEKESGCTVLTRNELIISIFEKRADSRSGKLKVASSVINREKDLFRHRVKGLSRIKGGIGLKGPGETKEKERKRILRNRESHIRKALRKEHDILRSQRKNRTRDNIPVVCLVGYTNAGKSTLFNTLLNRNVSRGSDELFTSIDPVIRRLTIFGEQLLLVDTVGLIDGMNNDVLDTFIPTFGEIAAASLILHIIDPTDINWRQRKSFVEHVLSRYDIDISRREVLFSKKDLPGAEIPPGTQGYSIHQPDDVRAVRTLIVNKLSDNPSFSQNTTSH